MELRSIKVDRNFRERIEYKDVFFPVDIWTDVYNTFVDKTMNCHWHEEFEFGVVLSGELDYYINDTYFRLVKGDCIFVNSNMMHMAKQPGNCCGAVMFTIVFPSSLFAGNPGSPVYRKYFQPLIDTRLQGFVVRQDNRNGKAMVDGLNAVYNLDGSSSGYELRCLGYLSTVWDAMVSYIKDADIPLPSGKIKRPYEKRVKDILSFIHDHYQENLTVEDIARHAGISRNECFRCFKKYVNKKPVEYINEYRLARAARLLRETNDTVTEICIACGFSGSSYFGKLFREAYGTTPLKYRCAGREA